MRFIRFTYFSSLLSVAFADITPIDYAALSHIVQGRGYVQYPLQAIKNITGDGLQKRQDPATTTNVGDQGTVYVLSGMI
jgi:hypothetical protein